MFYVRTTLLFVLNIAFILIAILTARATEVPGLNNKNLIKEGMPDTPEAYQETNRGFVYYSSNSFLAWENDRRILINKKKQLHRLKGPLAKTEQLTFFTKKSIGAASPIKYLGDDGFLIKRDSNGDEYNQYYFMDRLSRKSIQLTDPAYRYRSALVTRDGTHLIFSRSLGTSSIKSVSSLSLVKEGAIETKLFETKNTFTPLDSLQDGKTILLRQYVSNSESYLVLLNSETGALDYLTSKNQKWAFNDAVVTKDGKGLYLVSNMGSDVANLRYMDLDTRKIYFVAQQIIWPIKNITLSPDGKKLAIVSNQHGLNKLYFLNTRTNKLDHPEGKTVGIISRLTFSPDSKKVAMNVSHPLFPRDIFVYHLKKDKLVKWTESRNKSTRDVKLSMPKLVFYNSFDNLTIPAYVYAPLPENKKYDKSPVIITLHGGPASQHNPSLSTKTQYYANRMGITVIAPNVRGSEGYGNHYVSLDNGYKREDSVKDVGALLDWIKTQPDLDPDRVMVIGGSYGGYMVLASLMHYGDRLKAGIDRVGISQFTTFLKNTADYRVDLRRVEYGDERDPDMRAFHTKISPLNNAHKITKPLFVVQGQNDPRVPASEARQIVDAVRQNGVPVWYLLARNEGHGFKKSKNSRFLNRAVISFIRTYLLDEKVPG